MEKVEILMHRKSIFILINLNTDFITCYLELNKNYLLLVLSTAINFNT